ncbi:hypothetical protein C8J31_102119 [Rhizobium sp. PP-CC-2G-626]|nr:hypothetical protein C8J31_102119 [Rhizobium sp. PP-CC-2G-626]
MSIILSLRVQKGKSVLRGNNHFWSVVMERHRAGQTFSQADIFAASNDQDNTIRDFIRRMEKAGVIQLVEQAAKARESRYRPTIIQSRAPRARRDGSIIESQPGTRCMWNLMRAPTGRSGFTYHDLISWGATDETKISAATARSYITMLFKAGYLIKLDAGKPGTAATWRLNPGMNTGPQAPMILRTKLVYDPNRGEVFGPAEAEEVEA